MAYTTIDDPTDYFNTVLYSGTGGTQSITGVGFQPDWVWIKNRSDTHQHVLSDSVRGTGKELRTDITAAETTNNDITAFGSDGFSISSNGQVSNNGNSYASWNWKAGTSVSGNTGGSGTAKAYSGSVNTDAGFSIITYLGNGTAGHTIPHHLGVVPQMLIVKERANANSWYIYHHSLGNTKNQYLNTTHAEQTDGVWNDTTPTSSVFTVSDADAINRNDGTTVAYCFAEKKGYSKFGSYIGNGNADGPFSFTGFKPAFVILKNHSDAGAWIIIDNKRQGATIGGNARAASTSTSAIEANSVAIEAGAASGLVDILSNGFKVRETSADFNTSAKSYIYMAFAENPFVTSKGVPATAR